jgi:quercetin dioxygenase-like cupin family protein
MLVMNFADVGLLEWDSPNITARTRKAVPFAEGAEQVDISFIRFPPGVHSTYHVHPADQVLVAADGVGFIETADGRAEFRPGDVVHCPAGERHRHGAVPHAHLDQVSIVVARRLGKQGADSGGQ